MQISVRSILPLALSLLLVLAGAPACGGGGGGSGKKKKKVLGFRVLMIDPADGELFVDLEAEIVAEFSSPISTASISKESFFLSERASRKRILGTVELRGANQIAAFIPSEPLLRNTKYRVRIYAEVTSTGGDGLEEEFVSDFTTKIHTVPPPPPPPPAPRGRIRSVGDMVVGRSSHRATLLTSRKVLVTGGFDTSASVTATAELFDPVEEKFKRTSLGLADARGFHTATRLGDGGVLILGGVTGSALKETASAEIYNPISGAFVKLTAKMVNPRAFHTATLLSDGRVLIAGGTVPTSSGVFSSRTAEIFDPKAGTFTALSNMAAYRAAHTATVLANGKVLLVGGNGTDTAAELFDPANNTFNTLAGTLKMPRRGHSSSLLLDGTVLVMGGGDRTGELYVTDKDFFRWTPGFPLVERKDHTATLLPDGRVVFTGGSHQQGSTVFFSRTTELYDPKSGAFLGNGPMLKNPTTRHRATTLADGSILITGGSNLDPKLPELRTAEIYFQEKGD